MPVVQFGTPNHFRSGGQIERIGFINQFLYVGYKTKNLLEVWRVHCLTPSSWEKIYALKCAELFYVYLTFSRADSCVWILLLAVLETESVGQIYLLKIDPQSREMKSKYTLDHAHMFEDVSFERIALGCRGEKGTENHLYLFDRSMVMGDIAFYLIRLNECEKSFVIENKPIRSDENLPKCTRFPVVLDGNRRQVLKLTNNNEILLYDGNMDVWKQLSPDPKTDLDLSNMTARGLAETYGINWHRYGAVESSLSIYADGPYCVFKLYQNGHHTFYHFVYSEAKNTYSLNKCSRAKLGRRLETMFYLHCTDSRVAFINKYQVGFVNIQPPTLRAICYWRLQQMFAINDRHMGVWRDGKNEKELQEIFNINQEISLM